MSAARDLEAEQLRSLSTPDLLKHAVSEARLLAKAEVLHAKHELKDELKAAKHAGVILGSGATLAITALALLLASLAVALPIGSAAGLLLVGLALAAAAVALALLGYRKVPRHPLPKTQGRLKADLALTREQLT